MKRARYLLIAFAGMIACVGFVGKAEAQYYYVFDFEASGLSGGSASATIDITINGQELEAVIRNTSPNQDNYGGDSSLGSPTISGFGFDGVGDLGGSADLQDWTFTAFKKDVDGNLTNKNLNGTNPKWITPNETLEFAAEKDKNGLHNPDATGGLANTDEFSKYTGYEDEEDQVAKFTATFDDTVNLIEDLPDTFSPFVRFGNVGSATTPETIQVVGILRGGGDVVGGHANPEPASVFIWGLLGVATCVGMNRRWRSTRKA